MVEAVNYQPLSGDSIAGNVNLQEYYLQGSIYKAYVGTLRERLQGLCDNVEPTSFSDHERTYYLKNPMSQAPPIVVKTCKSIIQPNTPWQMKYVGSTDGSRDKSTLIRSSVTVAASTDPGKFLEDLGFQMQFEITLNGFFYRKGNMKITVSRVVPVPHQNQSNDAANAEKDPYIVEISALATSRDESAANEIRIFASHLKPIITLDKIDPRRLQPQQAMYG